MTTSAPPPIDLTLAVEASTYRGSVALLRDGRVLAEESVAMRGATEERLMPAVAQVLASADVYPAALQRVVCGAGPGSFTSLRIAGAIAKGVALAHGVPLYAVSSLLLVATGGERPLAAGRYLAVTDAMRDEWFVAVIDVAAGGVAELAGDPARLDAGEVAARAAELGAVRIGPAEEAELWPHARGVGPLLPSILAGDPVELASWEPTYGRLPEAQVKWEAAHGRALPAWLSRVPRRWPTPPVVPAGTPAWNRPACARPPRPISARSPRSSGRRSPIPGRPRHSGWRSTARRYG